MRDFLCRKLDNFFKVQCSNEKSKEYKFFSLDKALDYNFIRFGNKYFIPALSVDIDNSVFPEEQIKTLNLPTPTFIVKTTRGFHIHWFFKNPVSTSNKKQIRLLSESVRAIQEALGADKYATTINSGRIWRNPLKHETIFSGKEYNISEIYCGELPKSVDKDVSKHSKGTHLSMLSVDFSKVLVGTRHMTMFNYARAFAYTTGVVDIYSEIDKKNNIMANPLQKSELLSISDSIKVFMTTRYKKEGTYTASQERISFNQRVAKGQEKKKLTELSTKLLTFFAPLQILIKSTIRSGSKLLATSKTTYTKHKKELIRYIKKLLLTKINFINPTDNFSIPLFCPTNFYIIIPRYTMYDSS